MNKNPGDPDTFSRSRLKSSIQLSSLNVNDVYIQSNPVGNRYTTRNTRVANFLPDILTLGFPGCASTHTDTGYPGPGSLVSVLFQSALHLLRCFICHLRIKALSETSVDIISRSSWHFPLVHSRIDNVFADKSV